MTNIHRAAVFYILKQNEEPIESFWEENIQTLLKRYFHNYHNNRKGLRLTREGFDAFKKTIRCYYVEFPNGFTSNDLKAKHIFYLDRHMAYPYYVYKWGIYTFSKHDSFQLVLMSGDLDTYADFKAIEEHDQRS